MLRTYVLSGALLMSVCVLACGENSSSRSDEADLIDGRPAEVGTFPSTLQIVGNCTVTKVGERHLLTAAHCVRDERGNVRADYQAGSSIRVRLRGREQEREVTLEIARTVLHPRIEFYCSSNGCYGRASDERRDAPDLAIMEVKGGLDGVPVASVDVTPVAPGDRVSILGYGCRTDVWGETDNVLRHADTQILGVEASVHSGGLNVGDAEGLASIDANYVVTPGPTKIPAGRNAAVGDASADAGGQSVESAGLCPGDSGGALYRAGTNIVVGVNASYTFLPDGMVPVTNWHARVDRASRWGTASWLESMGVAMTRSCEEAACVPARANDDDGGRLDGGAKSVDGGR